MEAVEAQQKQEEDSTRGSIARSRGEPEQPGTGTWGIELLLPTQSIPQREEASSKWPNVAVVVCGVWFWNCPALGGVCWLRLLTYRILKIQ